jgi:DUF4097 and DUF4098 domain-containing protein YvlB
LDSALNADLEAHGMNGRVMSDVSGLQVQENKHGNYSARIGTGGSSINARGINGNIRLTRAPQTVELAKQN